MVHLITRLVFCVLSLFPRMCRRHLNHWNIWFGSKSNNVTYLRVIIVLEINYYLFRRMCTVKWKQTEARIPSDMNVCKNWQELHSKMPNLVSVCVCMVYERANWNICFVSVLLAVCVCVFVLLMFMLSLFFTTIHIYCQTIPRISRLHIETCNYDNGGVACMEHVTHI